MASINKQDDVNEGFGQSKIPMSQSAEQILLFNGTDWQERT
jgi:hypothetical protein